MAKKYDFCGWATKNDVRCADGRIIRKNAFLDNNGKTVPLVWNHVHSDPEMVLGHALLENKEDGVYMYASLNNSKKANHVREAISHGDVNALSIYANKLVQNGSDVIHGLIREVSVVIGGANPQAFIEDARLAHGDLFDDEFLLFINEDSDILSHSDEEDEATPVDEEKQEEKVNNDPEKDESLEHADEDKTVGDVLKTLNEDQKKAVAILIDAVSGDDDEEDDDNEEDDADMKHNVFDNDLRDQAPVLSQSDMKRIFADWKKFGSLKDTLIHHMQEGGVLAHAVTNADGSEQTYGIADIDYLFPDAKTINDTPDFISRQMDWVKKVMNGTRHTPFSRVKSIHANITMDEARARGYMKGNRKQEEVFSLLKRVTTPQTIYKKQKLDRDDILDITDFNVVSWIKQEMRMMLEEECARAILIGDGRSVASEDKISEEHIRPIWKDDSLYTIRKTVTAGADDAATAKNLIKDVIRARKDYRGSGNLVFFTTADWHTEMLLLEDATERPLYDTDEKLRTKLRVSDIVDVEPMEDQVYTDASGNSKDLIAIAVDLRDYNIGADKGGQTTTFEDFDIDYNQEKYLMETRFSGALVRPYSAIVFEKTHTA